MRSLGIVCEDQSNARKERDNKLSVTAIEGNERTTLNYHAPSAFSITLADAVALGGNISRVLCFEAFGDRVALDKNTVGFQHAFNELLSNFFTRGRHNSGKQEKTRNFSFFLPGQGTSLFSISLLHPEDTKLCLFNRSI